MKKWSSIVLVLIIMLYGLFFSEIDVQAAEEIVLDLSQNLPDQTVENGKTYIIMNSGNAATNAFGFVNYINGNTCNIIIRDLNMITGDWHSGLTFYNGNGDWTINLYIEGTNYIEAHNHGGICINNSQYAGKTTINFCYLEDDASLEVNSRSDNGAIQVATYNLPDEYKTEDAVVRESSVEVGLGQNTEIDSLLVSGVSYSSISEGYQNALGAKPFELSLSKIVEVSSVAISDVIAPQAGLAFSTNAHCTTEGVADTAPIVVWKTDDTIAGYEKSYTVNVTLNPEPGYVFSDTMSATINGQIATSVMKNNDGSITATYTFPATDKDKLTSITAPQSMTVANGTAYEDMGLPTTVTIVTEGSTVTTADVAWNITTPASGSYAPALLTEQTVTLNGTVTCPAKVDANGVELKTTISITISAAGIVGASTVNPAAGTYTENQTVVLTTTTDGATIYYTTDGTTPSKTNGTKYTTPITVSGEAGQSVETTIKVIAIKDGMQDSSVETFEYTINIPMPTQEPDPVDYEILEGEDETWILDSDGNLTIKGNGDFSKFVGVKVDGNLLDTKYYTAKEGSTIVTIKAEYLNALSVGNHIFEIVWSDGFASTNITIEESLIKTPLTGDMTSIIWFYILLIIGGMGLIFVGRKVK